MPGYSPNPLSKKLGLKAGDRVLLVGAPDNYRKLLQPLPTDVHFVTRVSATTDVIQIFSTQKAALQKTLTSYRTRIKPTAVIWVSWPKKSAKVPTDIVEDVIRDIALPLGYVDIKVCAVDDVWSGLKLVIRKEVR